MSDLAGRDGLWDRLTAGSVGRFFRSLFGQRGPELMFDVNAAAKEVAGIGR